MFGHFDDGYSYLKEAFSDRDVSQPCILFCIFTDVITHRDIRTKPKLRFANILQNICCHFYFIKKTKHWNPELRFKCLPAQHYSSFYHECVVAVAYHDGSGLPSAASLSLKSFFSMPFQQLHAGYR